MKMLHAARAVAATLTSTLATVALASEATGTEAVGEMNVSGTHLLMGVGALALLGAVVYGVTKVMK